MGLCPICFPQFVLVYDADYLYAKRSCIIVCALQMLLATNIPMEDGTALLANNATHVIFAFDQFHEHSC